MWAIMMNNIPTVKLGVVAVSRDCFPMELSRRRRVAVVEAYKKRGGEIYEAQTIIENELDMKKALEELNAAGCNALVVYLGNFGPETPETLLCKYFSGPCMFAAAAEETGEDLVDGRGDAYCGMLNASYNLKLRELKAYIPEYPVGTASEVAEMIAEFVPVARAVIGLSSLKLVTFGPRPDDFLACNAPIKRLFDIDVEVQENSELDLLLAFQKLEGDARIADVAADMARELGGETNPILTKLAQYELTLLDWAERAKGAREYIAFANKCWPAFQHAFGFVPCYVNSRLAAKGIPVSCEVDLYGALSEYIGVCVSDDAVTLLDVNNTVPADLYDADIKGKFDYKPTDLFMGFHCGNTCSSKLVDGKLSYQLIMSRTAGIETSTGTLNGDIAPGAVTLYRLQSTADSTLRAYVAEGEVLPVATRSFGGIGIVGVHEMQRFYRHVLIEKAFPHHGAFTFGHFGKALFEVFKYIGITDISYNRPAALPYASENPFK